MNIFFWRKKSPWEKYLPLGLLLLFVLLVVLFNVKSPLTFENLKGRYAELMALETANPLLFTLYLFAIYVISICLVIPDSTLISLLAGTVYPFPIAVLFISISETVGALCFYFIVKYAFKEYFAKKEAHIVHGKIGKDFREHEIYYLLFLRFSHLLPFWVINVIAALFKTHPLTFIWTTFIGTLPLSIVLAQAGRSLEKALVSNEPFSLQNILNRPTELCLIGLGLLVLIPVLLKKFSRLR
ncbi:MAG: VTT domain-containing protein [Chlamydiae bacterium]|nr:VTT domain-containing protein [Chlamydiota bacterium]